ncbi:MAG: VOC family protein [Chitinispirillales bacterium]|jgi:lactoylglutathione lyase/glyoxylase I family protein|nr:VOC family protein [Chitinispirillales bacterium]
MENNTTAPLFNKIAHVCLYVKNLERSVDYYKNLGFTQRFTFHKKGELYGAYLEFGSGNFIELFEDTSIDLNAPAGRMAHFCLETSDIDAVMEELTKRGAAFTPKKFGCDSTYQIWLKDPDGNDFEIHQYTSESLQLTGGDVEADW